MFISLYAKTTGGKNVWSLEDNLNLRHLHSRFESWIVRAIVNNDNLMIKWFFQAYPDFAVCVEVTEWIRILLAMSFSSWTALASSLWYWFAIISEDIDVGKTGRGANPFSWHQHVINKWLNGRRTHTLRDSQCGPRYITYIDAIGSWTR